MHINTRPRPPVLLGANIWERIGKGIMDTGRGIADIWTRMGTPHVIEEPGSRPVIDPGMTTLLVAGGLGLAAVYLIKRK